MLRVVLCVTIVAAFPLGAAAAGAISEDIPIPGGTAALARAAGIRETPDRPRFAAEVTRLIFELPLRRRQDPSSHAGRLTAHLLAAARFQRALAALGGGGVVSLAAARGGGLRPLTELLDVVGLRIRERRGAYFVEPTGRADAAERVRLLANLGIDLVDLADSLNRGDAVTMSVPVDTVPVPLTAALWSNAILGRTVPASEIFAAIIADDRAALLCHGLASLDDPTLEFVAAHPAVLQAMYANAAVFAAFGSHLRIRGGRIVTPAEAVNEAARAIWEDLVEVRTNDPARFVAALFEKRAGRLAYLYDTVGELDPPRAAFALGLWIKDAAARITQARALADAITAAYPEWPTPQRPFVRPLHEFGSLLMAVAVLPDGTPDRPSTRLLWARAFDGPELPVDPGRELRDEDRAALIDAAWLGQTIAATDVRQRGQRLMQLAFGYRVFGDAGVDDLPDVLVALRAFARYRTAMLALEQMGVTRPAVYAAAARQSDALSRLDAGRAFVALSQFQGALAILVRLAASGGVAPSRIEELLIALCGAPVSRDGRLAGAIADWVRRQLLNGDDDSAEFALVTALAGPPPSAPRVIEWEGGRYQLDLAAAEAGRLRRVRQRQGGYSLDAAVLLHATAQSLAAATIDLDGVKRAIGNLGRVQPMLPRKAPVSASEIVPGGAERLPDPREIVDRSVRELGRLTRPRDLRRANEIGGDLLEAADIVLAEVLSSLAYALTLGDPQGPTLLGGDVARRHDFGVGSRVPGVRESQPWSIPEQHYDPGVPWHVTGSLIGLDAALAPLALRRLEDDDGLLSPPVLGSNERETFARSVALLNPYRLQDAERDRIGLAIARGRQRVMQARTDDDIDGLADAVRMDGWRRRALRWTAAHEPDRKVTLLSLTELFMLGGGELAAVHAWGAAMTPSLGCLCLRMPPPNVWRLFTGRPQVGVLGSSVPDVPLYVAASLHELDLPAGLTRSIVSAAMQQYVDTVRPNDGNDWLGLVRGAQDFSRERFEDFVAAAASVGGPLIPLAATVPER